MTKPAELRSKNESGKAGGGETSFSDSLMGYTTVISCGNLGEAAEETGLGCVDKSAIGLGEWEEM